MKKSSIKIRAKKETEKSYRVEYTSCVDSQNYWTIIHARNFIEVEDLFNNEFYTDKSTINKIEEIA